MGLINGSDDGKGMSFSRTTNRQPTHAISDRTTRWEYLPLESRRFSSIGCWRNLFLFLSHPYRSGLVTGRESSFKCCGCVYTQHTSTLPLPHYWKSQPCDVEPLAVCFLWKVLGLLCFISLSTRCISASVFFFRLHICAGNESGKYISNFSLWPMKSVFG